MTSRIGVDIGGTFTDLVSFDEELGQLRIAKVPTTPGRPEEGCRAAFAQAGIEGLLGRCSFFLHGTTVGLNALLERRGSVVGLLCTAGFRDVLEIRRGDRDKYYDLTWQPPEPLVPRRLRLGVRERVRSDGAVEAPLNEEDIADAVAKFRAEGVTSIAIVYLNAYANGAHESQTERLLRTNGFDGAISLSHRISGEYREYERTTTTVIDAFVRERMSDYLGRLDGHLRSAGFRGVSLVTRSGGGAMSFAEAEERPFETIMSGPVAGAEGAGDLTRRTGLGDLITADVGGTSFDTCVIVDGRPQLLYQGKIVGLPVQSPWVDVRSIGAGGGSIARVDAGGLLQVGPESAASVPGPACYGRGGIEPTLTDAAYFLGMLGTGELSAGLVLDQRKARGALQRVAAPLGESVERAAQGIVRIAAANMANAIREITIQTGLDPRNFSLLAFGGAGPMVATELARELDIRRVVVPPHAGNFSAWGLLGADLVQSAARTRLIKVSDAALPLINALIADLLADLRSRGTKVASVDDAIATVAADMRFVGQEHAVTVELPMVDGCVTGSGAELRQRFEQAYERMFSAKFYGDVEIVVVRASLRRLLPRRVETLATTQSLAAEETIETYSFARGTHVPFQIVARDKLKAGQQRNGPLIVIEATTTTYVDVDFTTEVDRFGCLHLIRIGDT